MRPAHPPAAATWLLENFTFRPRNSCLVGDLAEEYRAGRSHLWYWGQALAALMLNLARGLRTHTFYVARALLTGWLVLYLTRFACIHFYVLFERRLATRYPLPFGHPTWPPDGLVFWVLWIAAGIFTGWIVARLHRAESGPVVFLFSASVLLWNLRLVPWFCTLAVDSFSSSRYIPYLVSGILGFVLATPVSSLLGGMYASNNESVAEAENQHPAAS